MKKFLTLALLLISVAILAVSVNAAVGTVVYGYKTDTAPNLEEIDESWGEPCIYVDKNSPNTELHKYWTEEIDTCYYTTPGTGAAGRTTIQPEPSDFWMYVLYDRKNLYIGIKSPDTEPSGGPEAHRGDGARIWLQPLDSMVDPYSGYGVGELTEYEPEYQLLETYYHYYWNMSKDMSEVDRLYASKNVDIANISFKDGYMHAIIEIPLSFYGLAKEKNLNGFEFGTAIMRCSSRSPSDEGYAGWLSWGATLPEYTPLPTSVNTIILVDPDAELPADQTTPIETEAPVTEAPATEAPVTEAPATEAPATEAPATETPATETPATETPATETLATETPATEAPATEAPATETPATETPETEAPVTEAPVTEAPATEAPATETPATETPETETPETETPATEAPVTEAPATETPATEAPVASNTANKPNTALNVGIIVAVIVVGLGIVALIKNKKKK